MMQWLKAIDGALRGHKEDPRSMLKEGGPVRLRPLILASLLLGVIYGLFMGLYATFNRTSPVRSRNC